MIRLTSIFVVLGALLVAGCGNEIQPAAVPVADATMAQIKAIENNPNMPADQKEAALARLRQQAGMKEALNKQVR